MGIIRKTLSISTLGIVPFRSKKELLRRAEKDRRAAEAELSREHAARAEADRRVAAAEKRVQKAELTTLHEAKAKAKAMTKAKAKRKNGRGKRGRRGPGPGARDMIGDLIAAAQPVVEIQAKAVGRRARKAAKASRHAAELAQIEATRGGRRARARLREVEQVMAPRVGAAAERVQAVAVERVHAVKGDLIDLAAAATDKLKERDEASHSSD